MESVERNNLVMDETKILEGFKNRVKSTSFNLESVNAELEKIAASMNASMDELFVLAETDQLPADLNDNTMSLFSIAKTLRA
jgi:xylose isomerase